MNYRVKIKGGLSIFHDKSLAEKWAKKHKSKVEVISKTWLDYWQYFCCLLPLRNRLAWR